MTTRIDYEYYAWLKSQIHIPNEKTYDELFERMHNVEFVWTVPNDDNRVQDALDLRSQFANGHVNAMELGGATFLEVLVALSRRVAFISGGIGEPPQWAWELMKNLRLHRAADPMNKEKQDKVDHILHDVIWRTYREDGLGGFFPLQNPDRDQRQVEIWYQMNAYVNEMSDL